VHANSGGYLSLQYEKGALLLSLLLLVTILPVCELVRLVCRSFHVCVFRIVHVVNVLKVLKLMNNSYTRKYTIFMYIMQSHFFWLC